MSARESGGAGHPGRFRLDGRVAVVTGACGKLGPIWMHALHEAGATVLGLDLPDVSPGHALDDLLARGRAIESRAAGEVALLAADVTDRGSLDEAREAIEERWGAVAVLVNNAGVDQPPGPVQSARLEDIPADVCARVVAVNLLGLFQATQAFIPSLRRAHGASVINLGSIYGHISPDPRLYEHIPVDPPFLKPPLYGASKAGVDGLTRYLATHLAPDGIRVNSLVPGGVEGGQDPIFREKFCARVPLGRMAGPDDLVGPLIFLASQASSYVTGQALLVDGGLATW